MAPKSQDVPPLSSIQIKPLPNRHSSQNSNLWLQDRARVDGAEGLWRVHDGLYDLEAFIKYHPGGTDWITLTKGTDCTEAFEVHHLTTKPNEVLEKYFVRNAKTSRSSAFTFKEDGFYRTLKREIMPMVAKLPKQPINTTAFFIDSLLALMFLFAILAGTYSSYWLATVSGIFLGLLTIAAHNYFHQKDNFRMHYFNFSMMQVRDWRVSHVLSHHLHTNTIDDMEITQVEPFLHYLPNGKTDWMRYGPWMFFPLLWFTTFHGNFAKRMYYICKGDRSLIQWYDFVPYVLPVVMYVTTNQSLLGTIALWSFIVAIGSLHFAAVGYNAAHHHPDIFHDGDAPRFKDGKGDTDWGVSQLDALMDRKEITGSHFLVLTNFGDHALHHMFPTLDHGTLEHIYPIFDQVCKRFDVKLRFNTQLNLVMGSFQQMARTKANPNPPDLFKKYY